MSKELKELSRQTWNSEGTIENIQLGAILRIADATEKMCLDREKLERDLKYWQERHKMRGERIESLENTIRSLKGHNTRLKNKLNNPLNTRQ